MAEPSRDAVGVWIRLAKCYGLMLREVRRAQAARDLTLPQFDALAQLLRQPEGVTASALSEALLVTAGNVTGIVDRLCERGWVTRTPSPHDARVRVLTLTAEGRRVARREVARHERELEHVLRALSAGQKRDLARSLDRMRQALEA